MSAKHETREYASNARIIRAGVKAQHRRGEAVACWRCRRAIIPGQPFDVGHVHGAIGSSMAELAPEHRHRVGRCPGNRRQGGKLGAALTNSRGRVVVHTDTATSWPV